MTQLTDIELMTTAGGWDWSDFFRGFALGASLGAAAAAGTAQAYLAWGGGMASEIASW